MKAGRELDALVAERVMGATCRSGRDLLREDKLRWEHVLEDPVGEDTLWDWRHCAFEEYPDGRIRFHPEYSTDIAAAWEVVERMRPPTRTSTVRTVWHLFVDYMKDECGALGEYTLMEYLSPEAICLAALRAVGCDA